MNDVPELYQRAMEEFGARVHAIGPDQWDGGTPCDEWNVRELVNHIVGENRWVPPLFAGQTVVEVGDAFDGDLLGDEPLSAFENSATAAIAAVAGPAAMSKTIHVSSGDISGKEYTMQLFADLLVHAWDLAKATGTDERLDPILVDACARWFAEREEWYRRAGVIADRPEIDDDADTQTHLLAAFGRSA